jgi:subtilisin family serine protease
MPMPALSSRRFHAIVCLSLALGALHLSTGLGSLSAQGWEPNDPFFRDDALGGVEEQWNLMADGRGIGATKAWELSRGSPAVVIANLDSGIQYRHEDLRNQLYLHRGELPLPVDSQGRSSGDYDLNGDGMFNVLDYAQDSRVADPDGDGVDVGDLLRSFSDGIDDDRNGYVDDMSGWDFFDDDNDVFDAASYGHGTGTASIHSAETDNGKGIAGVAPGCRLLALRMGDTPHVGQSQILAEAVIYAADNGARVVSMSLGSMSNTPFLRQALRYARERGTVCVAAMGNEYSFHHNYPVSYDEVIGVGAIHPNTSGLPYPIFFPTSWVTRASYSDYGGHIDVVAPSWVRAANFPEGYNDHAGGTSSATPHVSGVAALIVSGGLELGLEPPLDPDEVRQIIRQTAEDIVGTEYGCHEGFDIWTGYGRVRPDLALASLYLPPQTIPPVARILSPAWYATVDPLRSPRLSVRGEARADRSTGYWYTLEWAPGADPTQDAFEPLCSSGSFSQPFEGELCEWDIRGFAGEDSPPPSSPNGPAVTLRLTVTDLEGNAGEDRRIVFLHHDHTLHPGFPQHLGTSGEASLRVADLDGDNRREIVLATADGHVTVLRPDGTLFESIHGRQTAWPVTLDPVASLSADHPANHLSAPAFSSGLVSPGRIPIVSTPAVGDLDRDGLYEIVVAAMNGKIYVFEADGRPRCGFPVSTDPDHAAEDPWLEPRFLASPALGDIDRDGFLDIVAAAMDQRVYAWRQDGTPVPGWPALARDPVLGKADKIVSSVAIGDIDGLPEDDEGRPYPEIVVGTNEVYGEFPSQSARLYAFDHDGRLKPGWPVELPTPAGEMLPTVGKGHPMSPLLVDLDLDGRLEVVSYAVNWTPMIFSGNGTVRNAFSPAGFGRHSNSTEALFFTLPANAALGDLNGDGSPELVMGGVGGRVLLTKLFEALKVDFDHLLGCWDLSSGGRFLSAFPRVADGFHFITQPAIADVNGDRIPEILDGTSHYLLHAIDAQGREPDGWPKFTGGWIVGAPTVGDLDGDGLLEVALNTREGNLYVWDTLGEATQEPGWWTFHHDGHSTGNYHADTYPPDSVDDLQATCAEDSETPGLLLTWTAVGDNGRQGRAAAYEIRRHTGPIDPFNWPEAERLLVSLTPGESGSEERLFLPDLPAGAHVAVRAVDEAGNLSGLYPATTSGPPSGGASAGEEGGCGCAVFPAGQPTSGLQPLAGILLYGLPALFPWLVKRRISFFLLLKCIPGKCRRYLYD